MPDGSTEDTFLSIEKMLYEGGNGEAAVPKEARQVVSEKPRQNKADGDDHYGKSHDSSAGLKKKDYGDTTYDYLSGRVAELVDHIVKKYDGIEKYRQSQQCQHEIIYGKFVFGHTPLRRIQNV